MNIHDRDLDSCPSAEVGLTMSAGVGDWGQFSEVWGEDQISQ